MTETERQVRNEQVLDLAGEQVAAAEAELAQLGKFEEDRYSTNESIQKLKSENARLRSNEDSLDKAKRVTRLRDNLATISVEEWDAQRIESEIATTKAQLLLHGRVATSACAEIISALSTARRRNVVTVLGDLLDLTKVGPGAELLSGSARCILELEKLEYYFSYSMRTGDDNHQIFTLRSLREHFSELRQLCEGEAGLVIPKIALELTPVAKLQPIVTEPAGAENALGTLSQAIAA